MPLFGKSPKSPQELVKGLRDHLSVLGAAGGAKKADKVGTHLMSPPLYPMGYSVLSVLGGGEIVRISLHIAVYFCTLL